jgi:L-cysteine desulfidase
MAICSKEEISVILHAAEILKSKGFSAQINVSQFCKEAEISRKNAYKHKNNITITIDHLEKQIAQLEQEKKEVIDQLSNTEKRAREADLNWELRNVLVALIDDYKKNGDTMTPKRQKLIENYNATSGLLGLPPLSF